MNNIKHFMEQFSKLPTIASQLPLVFKNGARFEEIDGQCNDCHSSLAEENFRGLINYNEEPVVDEKGVQTLEDNADMMAYGCCPNCNKITQFRYLLSAPHGELMLTEVNDGVVKNYKSKPFDYNKYWRSLL